MTHGKKGQKKTPISRGFLLLLLRRFLSCFFLRSGFFLSCCFFLRSGFFLCCFFCHVFCFLSYLLLRSNKINRSLLCFILLFFQHKFVHIVNYFETAFFQIFFLIEIKYIHKKLMPLKLLILLYSPSFQKK